MEKVYNHDDYPKPVDPTVATGVKSLLSKTPVRDTHEAVNDSKKPKGKAAGQTCEQSPMQLLSMIASMMQKAKKIDECTVELLQPVMKNNAEQQEAASTLAKSSPLALQDRNLTHSKSSLSFHSSSQDEPSALQMATIPQPDKADDTHQAKRENDNDVPPQAQSLEDYEKEAFQRLQGKQNGGKAFKRPACSKVPNSLPKAKSCPKAKAKPGPKAKAKGCLKACDKKQSKPAGNCWGCIRCRGNTSGCSTCKKQGFQGLRLNGRDAWKRWFNSRKA